MPSFDKLAAAAITPGGFQAGVNDIVQALLARKTNEAKLAQQQDQMAFDQNYKMQDLALRREGMGSQVADRLADQKYREAQLGLQRDELNWKKSQTPKDPTMGRPLTEAEQAELDEREVNLEMFGVPDIGKGIPSERPQVKTGMGFDPKTNLPSPIAVPTGASESWNRPLTEAELIRKNMLLKQRRDARGNRGPGVSAVHANTAPPGAAPTEQPPVRQGGMGAQIADSLGAKPAIDYEAEDAKLQASDPRYRQMRQNPRFQWRAAIDAVKAQGQ